MDKLIEQFSIGLFFWQLLIFLGLIFLLRKFAWRPILKAINEREEGIKNAIESAERAKEEMIAIKADNEKILRQARIERETILKEAREMRENILSKAKEEAKSIGIKELETFRHAIHQEKMAAQTQLKNEMAKLSIEIAEKVLKDELQNKEKQEALIHSFIKEIQLN